MIKLTNMMINGNYVWKECAFFIAAAAAHAALSSQHTTWSSLS